MLGSEILQKAKKYKIDYITRKNLEQKALKRLKLTNLNQLRDRYEGQSYLNKFLIREYSKIAVSKSCMEGKIEPNIDCTIISSSIEDYPLVPVQIEDQCYISFVNLCTHEVFLYGSFPSQLIVKGVEATTLSPIQQGKYSGTFTDFTLLVNNG